MEKWRDGQGERRKGKGLKGRDKKKLGFYIRGSERKGDKR